MTQEEARQLIPGQEVICPDGYGRFVEMVHDAVHVETYVKNRGCHWAPHNVRLPQSRSGSETNGSR